MIIDKTFYLSDIIQLNLNQLRANHATGGSEDAHGYLSFFYSGQI